MWAGLVVRTFGQIKPHQSVGFLSLGGMVKDQTDLPASLWGGQTEPEHGTVSQPGAHFLLFIMDPAEYPRGEAPTDIHVGRGTLAVGRHPPTTSRVAPEEELSS